MTAVRLFPTRSFLCGIEVESQDMFREREDPSTPETCLATPLPTLKKQC